MKKNLVVIEELKKQGKALLDARRDNFVRQSLLSDEFLNFMQQNKKPFDLLMSYYECAIMEVETKFRVLNHELSLEYDNNPDYGYVSYNPMNAESNTYALKRCMDCGRFGSKQKPSWWPTSHLLFSCYEEVYDKTMYLVAPLPFMGGANASRRGIARAGLPANG